MFMVMAYYDIKGATKYYATYTLDVTSYHDDVKTDKIRK